MSCYVIDSLEMRRLLSTLPSGFTETLMAQNLTTPTAMTFAPDGRLFFAQKTGEIKIVKNGSLLGTNFATVPEDSNNDRGLLGIALDPTFGQAGGQNYVYVYYTASSPTSHGRISRFLANGDVASGGEQVLLELENTDGATIHFGGAIQFGFDGRLYIAIGDHGNSSNAQPLTTTKGKILRINKDGTIPTDNPFFGQTSGIQRAIWTRGLRNPFTTATHPSQNLLYINDVGETSFEEINQGASGANYGWPQTEGTFNQSSFPSFTNPVHAYGRSVGACIIGGAFYTGATSMTFPSQYHGKYFFADFVTGFLKYMDTGTKAVSNFGTGLSWITAMDLAPDGSLWWITRGTADGGAGQAKIYRIQYTAAQAPTIVTQPASQTVAVGDNVTFTVGANGTAPFSYQWQRNGSNISGATSSSYTLNNAQAGDNNAKFRVIVSNSIGSATSNEATLTVSTNQRPTPTILTPLPTRTYGGGEVITYSGSGTDSEDGTLPASAFTWDIDLHHDTHSHDLVGPITGVASGSFTIPTTGEVSPNVFYRVTLTVRDSGGLTQTTTRDIQPRKASLTLATNIAGLALTLDGQPATIGSPILGVEGISRSIGAAATQTVGGVTYELVGWSDGGAATHNANFPSADSKWTAFYRRANAATTYASDLNWTSATNGWGPVERDRSNGENGAGDGGTITLNGVTYAKGLGTHANSTITYALNGAYTRFISDIGVDDESGGAASVIFRVIANGTQVYDSSVMTGTTATKTVDLDMTGVNTLQLVVNDAGNGVTDDHGDWAGVRFISGTTGGVTLAGTSGDDTFHMRLNSGGTSLDMWINAAPAGTPTQTLPASAIGQITVNGNDGNDTLTIDYSNGAFASAQSITFNGENGANDSLRFVGSSSADTVELSSAHLFVGALPIPHAAVESVRVEGAGGDDHKHINSTAPATTFIGGAGTDRLIVNGGTTSVTTDLGASGDTVQLQAHNNATVTLNATQNLTGLTQTGFARVNVASGGNKIVRTSSITLGPASTLDLHDNDAIVDFTGASPLPALQSLINNARNGGAWDKPGITSTAAKNRVPKNTTIGAALIDADSVMLKYTYYGDTDFNGIVNFDDYARIDAGFNLNRTGWNNGDFDGNGDVDFDDYALIDQAFNTQTTPL